MIVQVKRGEEGSGWILKAHLLNRVPPERSVRIYNIYTKIVLFQKPAVFAYVYIVLSFSIMFSALVSDLSVYIYCSNYFRTPRFITDALSDFIFIMSYNIKICYIKQLLCTGYS